MQVKKNGRKTIEKISKTKFEIISNILLKDFNVNLNDILNDNQILVNIYEKNKTEIYLIKESDLNFIKSLPINEIKHYGELMGYFFNQEFFYLFEFLDKIGPKTNNKLIVDSKGEQTTLYGRNITKRMLKKSFSKLKIDKLMILINESEEVIGLGKCLTTDKKLKSLDDKKVIIKNKMDKGWYLRKGN